jgi:hypothetical protein
MPPARWRDLTEDEVAAVGAHMGVYELADAEGNVVSVGYAVVRSPFGLRGELRRHLDRTDGAAAKFRVEVTTAYLSRYRELLRRHGWTSS